MPGLVPDNTKCQISGWGTLESVSHSINIKQINLIFFFVSLKQSGSITPTILQMANVTTNPRAMCARSTSYGSNMKAGMFCAGPFEGGVDSCQGKNY